MKFDKRRHICTLTEDGVWCLQNERDHILNVKLPKVREEIAKGDDETLVARLSKKKTDLLRRVLYLNQCIHYHAPIK